MKITSIEEILKQNSGDIVQLPGFTEGTTFTARVKMPSMMQLIQGGEIPNELLSISMALFNSDAKKLEKATTDAKEMKHMVSMMNLLAEKCLIEPSVEQLRENGIQLTDIQLSALLNYSQRGVRGLENFRQFTSDNQGDSTSK